MLRTINCKSDNFWIFLNVLQKVRENEGELEKHKQLSQRKEEEVNNLNSQLDTKRSETDQQQQELSQLRQDNVSTDCQYMIETAMMLVTQLSFTTTELL